MAVPLDVPGVQLPQLLLRPLGRVAQLREHRKKGVAAVPAAKACASTVAGGGFKIRVVPALVVRRPAPMEAPALPFCMRRACPAVGGRLEELHAHFIGTSHLQLASRLVHTGEHGTPRGHLDAVLMPAGVCDHGHFVCKAVHGLLDGGFVVEGTGAHFEPCSVQCAFKGPCDGVCRGGGDVLPRAASLPRTGIQQIVQGGALFKGGRLHVVVVIDRIFPLHGFGGGLQKQLADGRFALAAVLCQQLDHIIAQRFGLLVAPQLPVCSSSHFVHLADAPGNVLQDLLFDLLPELHKGIRHLVEIARRQHQAPPKVRASSVWLSALASAVHWWASSSLRLYRAARYRQRGTRPAMASSRSLFVRSCSLTM